MISTYNATSNKLPHIKVVDNLLYHKSSNNPDIYEEHRWKLWIPSSLTLTIIKNCHEPPNVSHGGEDKTLYRIRKHFFWPGMVKQVRDFISRCDICKTTKAKNITTRPPMGQSFNTERPFQQIYLDLLGPYPRSTNGNVVILVCLDHLTKYVFLEPLRQATSANIIKFLSHRLFSCFGVPETAYTDNGTQFVSNIFNDFLKSKGITHLTTPKYCPQSNASERVNRSVLAGIRSYLESNQKLWDKHLHEIEIALRSTIHQSLKISPYEALFGKNMVMHGSEYVILKKLNCLSENMALELPDHIQLVHTKLKEHIQAAHIRNEKSYNLRSRPRELKEGQIVYRKNFILSDKSKHLSAKLCKKTIKCRIAKVVGNNRYEVVDLSSGKSAGIFHGQHLQN